jgi:myo-inositol 2-dehydrogenase/D-chiro-inositol 1-dehydrogenase/scyllo-inositol 2-dehydrogenase (NAD+)
MKYGRLGVCIAGCGDMGTRHAGGWARLQSAEVVAVVDTDEERAEALARTWGLDTWYTDYRLAMAQEGVDLVSVCVPTCSHPEISIFAAEHGQHVLCEKPIALTLDEAEAMIAAARRNRVKLGVGFMRRHSNVLPALRDLLAAGELGRPVMYHARDARGIRPKREMHDARANGGPIIDMGVHLFDLWSYILDTEPVAVFATGLKLAQGRPQLAHIDDIAYDTATIQVRYQSGDTGTFVVSWGLPPEVNPDGVPDEIMGPRGLARASYALNQQQVDLMNEGGMWETVASSDEDMYEVEIARFAAWVLNDRPFPTGGTEGLAALRVALAALESVQTGRAVSILP